VNAASNCPAHLLTMEIGTLAFSIKTQGRVPRVAQPDLGQASTLEQAGELVGVRLRVKRNAEFVGHHVFVSCGVPVKIFEARAVGVSRGLALPGLALAQVGQLLYQRAHVGWNRRPSRRVRIGPSPVGKGRCRAVGVPGVTIRCIRRRPGSSLARAASTARSAQSGPGRATCRLTRCGLRGRLAR
jgi:hypothetical protein